MDCVVMENLLQIFLNLPSFSALFFVCTWPSEMCVSGAWKILSAADEACEMVGIISATVTCALIMLNNVSITSDRGEGGGGRGVHRNIFPISVFQSGFIGNLSLNIYIERRTETFIRSPRAVWKKAPVIIGSIDLWLTGWLVGVERCQHFTISLSGGNIQMVGSV